MSNFKNHSLEAAKQCAEAIQEARSQTAKIAQIQRELAMALLHLDNALNSATAYNAFPDLGRLQARIERIRELSNMQELGSYAIELERALDKAWQLL